LKIEESERSWKMKTGRTSLGIIVLTVAVLALPQLAMAAGADTNFGTTVTNSVTIQYGSGPSTITTSASVDFVVDRVLDWVVGPNVAATLDVYDGISGNAIAFSVRNDTNGPVDILLTLNALADAPSTVALYADDGDGTFDAGDTVLPTGGGGYYLDEVAEDAVSSLFIVVDVAAGAGTTDVYSYEIQTTTYAAGAAGLGADLIDDSGSADQAGTVQNVFNDGTGYTGATGDADGNEYYMAYAAFRVVAASLTASKTATVISDPVNGTTNPKAIPGANMRYVIQIDNNGTAAATSVTVEDAIPANTAYVDDSLYISGVQDPDDGVAPGDYNVTTAGAVTAPLTAPLLGGNSTTVGFTVQIQ
jgi:uncharacterized repeat protein (TIGR01451 family)